MFFICFFFHTTATTEIYTYLHTLSLHDALPICPASVLFGQGSIGGIVNLVSKTPDFTTRGEINLVYGSYDRKEVLGDVNLALADNLAEIGRATCRERVCQYV